MGKVKIDGFLCERCSHKWIARGEMPIVCPKCKSPYWNRARNKPASRQAARGGGKREK